MRKPILCLDFDGVIHSYASGWKGADIIPDPPVAGVADFIVTAQEHFTVVVHSSRSCQPGGVEAMKRYVHKISVDGDHDGSAFDAVQWPTEKPPAQVTIDDRALTFNGTWPRIEDLKAFQPWNKRIVGATGDHPQGRLTKDDEGGLKMAIGTKDGVVQVHFGKEVAWLGLDRATAIALGNNLIKHARTLAVH
jgi:hypothetical protein